jgi:transcriptional regulator with XRE-family HTH domain
MKLDKLNKYVEERGYGGISQLSSKLGISKEALRLIINGETKNPSVYTMAKIAEVLDCSIEELIGKSPKLTSLPTLHSVNAHYNKKLFMDVCNYVVNFIAEKLKPDDSNIKLGIIIDAIDAIYDYSYKTNPKVLDIQFANWYCQNSFL